MGTLQVPSFTCSGRRIPIAISRSREYRHHQMRVRSRRVFWSMSLADEGSVFNPMDCACILQTPIQSQISRCRLFSGSDQ